MKKIIFIIMLGLLLIPLVSAQNFLGTFQQSTFVDLKAPCFDTNNLFCNSTVNCTITINNPDSSNLINNDNMTRNPSFYNYTLNQTETSNIGIFDVTMQCVAPNAANYDRFTYDITFSGTQEEKSVLGIFLGMITLVIVFCAMGIINKMWSLKILSFTLSFIELLVMIFLMYAINKGADINGILFINFMASFIIGFGMFMLTGWTLTIKMMRGPEEELEDKEPDKWSEERWV